MKIKTKSEINKLYRHKKNYKKWQKHTLTQSNKNVTKSLIKYNIKTKFEKYFKKIIKMIDI